MKIGELIPNFHAISQTGVYDAGKTIIFGWYNDEGIMGELAGHRGCKEYFSEHLIKPRNTLVTLYNRSSNIHAAFKGAERLLDLWETRLHFETKSQVLYPEDNKQIVAIKVAPQWKQNRSAAGLFALIIRGGLGYPGKTLRHWITKWRKTREVNDHKHLNICQPYLYKCYQTGTLENGPQKQREKNQLVSFCELYNSSLKMNEKKRLKDKLSKSLSNIAPLSTGEVETFIDDEEIVSGDNRVVGNVVDSGFLGRGSSGGSSVISVNFGGAGTSGSSRNLVKVEHLPGGIRRHHYDDGRVEEILVANQYINEHQEEYSFLRSKI